MWNNDEELFELVRNKLYTAVVGDVLDSFGLYHQFLPPSIRPLREDMIVVGRAMPVLAVDVTAEHMDDSGAKPFGSMLEALDGLKPGEVYLCTGPSPSYALWGEIMSTRAQRLGSAGAVLNGYSRDTRGILSLNFPTFSFGSYAQDQRPRGRVVDFRVPVRIETTEIHPGALIFGDLEGVVVLSRKVEREVIPLALEKARKEQDVMSSMARQGISSGEAFDTFGVL